MLNGTTKIEMPTSTTNTEVRKTDLSPDQFQMTAGDGTSCGFPFGVSIVFELITDLVRFKFDFTRAVVILCECSNLLSKLSLALLTPAYLMPRQIEVLMKLTHRTQNTRSFFSFHSRCQQRFLKSSSNQGLIVALPSNRKKKKCKKEHGASADWRALHSPCENIMNFVTYRCESWSCYKLQQPTIELINAHAPWPIIW